MGHANNGTYRGALEALLEGHHYLTIREPKGEPYKPLSHGLRILLDLAGVFSVYEG